MTKEFSRNRKRVLILASFFDGGGRWIDDFSKRADFEFWRAPYPCKEGSWHERASTTPFVEWVRDFRYALEAMKWRPDCIVTCFPQLAFVVAASLLLRRGPRPHLVAWNFNLGSLPGGWKRALAGRIMRRVNRFVVHATGEIASYAKWLSVKENRFCFVPLQIGGIETPKPSPIPAPYLVSMGSANRDYKTLVEAISGTGIKTVIISKMDEINNLPERPELMKLANLTLDECHSILSGARLSVVPIANTETASGQVTFTTSMRMGVPTIANRSVGTVDYIRDGETGLLVPPGDATALRRAIESLWRNETLREQIGSAGRDYAEDHFSDEAAGRYFAQILDEVFAKQEEG